MIASFDLSMVKLPDGNSRFVFYPSAELFVNSPTRIILQCGGATGFLSWKTNKQNLLDDKLLVWSSMDFQVFGKIAWHWSC